MVNIGLCAKGFIYSQIVLLQLTNHHQSANAVDILEVYFDPPDVQYTVGITVTERLANGQMLVTPIAASRKTITQPDGKQMIKLDKAILANKTGVTFKFNHTNAAEWAIGIVGAPDAQLAKKLTFNYVDLLRSQQQLDD
uniref:Uncharacterized protein n=1 Tax=Globodera rostochiensis TaxID=31243 RepID=A0A914H5Q1_GLORO